jgi:pullulanase/glycogen debranching enzyme
MNDDEWKQDSARCLGVFLDGDALGEVDERAQPVKDESFLVLMNADHESIPFTLPALPENETGSPSLTVPTNRVEILDLRTRDNPHIRWRPVRWW